MKKVEKKLRLSTETLWRAKGADPSVSGNNPTVDMPTCGETPTVDTPSCGKAQTCLACGLVIGD